MIEVQPNKIIPVKYKGVAYVRIGARKSEANEEEERILREKAKKNRLLLIPSLVCTVRLMIWI